MFRNPFVFVLSFYRVHSPTPSARSLDERDPRAELPADAIEKAAEVITRQVVLKVAGIEVIREIEDLQTEFHSVFVESSRETDSSQNLQIQRGKVRKAPGEISRSDKITVLIDDRKREARADIQNRHERDSIWNVELTTEEKTIRYVPGQPRALICLNDRVLEVTKVGIKVVQITSRRRAYIRSRKLVVLAEFIERSNLEFSVTRAT